MGSIGGRGNCLTTAKLAFQVSQSQADQRLLERSEPATRHVVIPLFNGVLSASAADRSRRTSRLPVGDASREWSRAWRYASDFLMRSAGYETVKEECLSKLILFGEGSIRRVLGEFAAHYDGERNHQGKGNILPFPSGEAPTTNPRPSIRGHERLGGLLRYYYRKAT